MRFKAINKDKPFRNATTVRNAENSASINIGTPVIYKMGGDSYDGLDVVLPASSTAAKTAAFFAGIVTATITPGQIADSVFQGLVQSALVCRGTRAATTDAWPSFASVGLAQLLTLDTVANALGVHIAGASTVSPALANFAGSTLASTTTAASDAYTQWAGKTAATFLDKVMVRAM